METSDDNRIVRPKPGLSTLLKLAGATKDVLSLKEVIFYLGQYILQRQLYDKQQQHIVHCAQDALGSVLGVESFSVKEPRILLAMLKENFVTVPSQESPQSFAEAAGGSGRARQAAQEPAAGSDASSPVVRRRRRRRTRSSRSNDAGPSSNLPGKDDDASDADDDEGHSVKRGRSDSYSVTFDDSLSWYVIGGLGNGRDRHNSQSETQSIAAASDATASALADSDSDIFSVEFELESTDTDDYDEDDASLSADDQVYEFTFLEDEDSFDEDTEITEADYWRCTECAELNPPLPSNCMRCWCLRRDWLRQSSRGAEPPACADAPGPDTEDGVDVPDGAGVGRESQSLADSQDTAASPTPSCGSSSSQERSWAVDSQPSSAVDSQERERAAPELERAVSAETCTEPCLICQSRPKDGCIVHGKTGHLMSCYACARKLKKRNKLCPVCRMPIQAVVLTYFS
ncbi:E3 ubiquitin-protein ligase Mdm2 [Corythoichthys intestinalis]|uniref:E3 ubiquitin-protein ligase Mdm2 n=1 Tax=Corythoichthys intestinalis TaxID=161448 RepID=UPI0025A60B34|nr:E3 ubiquitin-protein ligase Mdm2 [Corythoichthys intestinalis]XP_057710703.1 E3 ubiquitin-protein ligase Mdm2 [Corythoichthys intestinalis]